MNVFSAPACVERCLSERGLLTAGRPLTVALSGGADSVFLLYCMVQMRDLRSIDLRALHVHHGLRGAEADRDESFCRTVCADLGVPLTVRHIDVPALCAESGRGPEETGRAERYRIFDEWLADCPDGWILTAHNASDNAETVLFHLTRGTGLRGLCGIPEERGHILRPLLQLTGEQIRARLRACGIPFVEDTTNADRAYTRNRLRHEVLPVLRALNPQTEAHILGACRAVREDERFLDDLARTWVADHRVTDRCDLSDFSALHPALRYRVAVSMHRAAGGVTAPERIHIRDLDSALTKGSKDFDLYFPDGIHVRLQDRQLVFSRDLPPSVPLPEQTVGIGRTLLRDRRAVIVITDDPAALPPTDKGTNSPAFSTFLGPLAPDARLIVRAPRPGDAYRYGGMTHKVKKLLCQKRLAAIPRDLIPILCDERGILWVPGFSARDAAPDSADTPDKNKKTGCFVYYHYLGGENE